jgi:NADH-quinone oxidoreductase subunit F
MSFEELKRTAESEWNALQQGQVPTIRVGAATCGRSAGANDVMSAIKEKLTQLKLDDTVCIDVGCLGLCYIEPMIDIHNPGRPRICYGPVSPETAAQLVEDYLVNDNARPDLAIGTIGEQGLKDIPKFFEQPTIKPQVRIALRNCGHIAPTNISHYIAHDGGFSGLSNALEMTPEDVIEKILNSGLRGRGGAGFPTGKKWEFCRKSPGSEKYIICNADEGDPGAFMDRSLLEGDPYSVLEGMLIGAYAIGATSGYIYIRAEYPLAIERLTEALQQMENHGLIGENILGSEFSFHITIKEGAGAFVCGEETALIASIEGKRGMPRQRPPFPASRGLWGKPTNINNVETWANVSAVLQKGDSWYAGYGTPTNSGTKTFALAGKIERPGLIEVPMGIILRQVIEQIGGGVPDGKKFKAVQTGGPSGGCIPASLLDSPVDFESFNAAGSIMGSGGMVVMDEDTCMVDIARYFLDFTQKESCGECVPCRLGTKQMLCILEDITQGKGRPEDIDLLTEICQVVKSGSLCGLGQTAPNPVLTTLRYFRDEYEAHIFDKRCPARVCKDLLYYTISPEKCTGCVLCAKSCPVEAITGEKKKVHVIDQSKCIKCGICLERCPAKFDAVECIPGQLETEKNSG